MRRPDPVGAGAPCRDQLRWARPRLDERLAALRPRGLALPPPIIPGERWFGDSQVMTHIRPQHQGTLLVEGKTTDRFTSAAERQVKGHDLLEGQWPWRAPPWEPRGRSGWLQVQSPTSGAVTVVMGGGSRTGALLPAVFGDDIARSATDPPGASSPLDRVGLSGAQAPVGDGGGSSAPRRCLLWAPGVTSDGKLRVVLYVTRDWQRSAHNGGDHLSSEALLAFCRA